MNTLEFDTYIQKFDGESKSKLVELHDIICEALPDSREVLKWGAPATLDSDGMILLIFSGHKQHMNFVVTPSTLEAHNKELEGYETGKGSVKLPYDKPLPKQLVQKLIRYRVKEYRDDGVKWK